MIRKDCTISMLAANLWGLAAMVPITLVCWGVYIWIWGPEYAFSRMGFGAGSAFIPLTGMFIGLLILVGGICMHEALHVLGWKVASGKPFSAFKFGIDPKTLSPFAHSKEPMALVPYRIGGALPGVVTGLLPYLIGLASGSPVWVFWGYLFLMAAVGDWMVLWLLRKVPANSLVEDHPSRAGCTILLDE